MGDMTRRTVGVEEEFLLVNEQGVPSPAAPVVIRQVPETAQGELHQEQVEIASRPATDLDTITADLLERRRRLARAAGRAGVRVAALAVSPLPARPTSSPAERHQRILAGYGQTARQNLICGCHVHVGITSPAEGIAALNGIQPWLPALLAISANSPFWDGADTGYASYRRQLYDRWPTTGPTAPFRDPAEYHAVVGRLVDSGILLDPAMVSFDARLSIRYPTVEIRVADVSRHPHEAVVIAALGRALVDEAVADGSWPQARPELLRAAAWQASRHGLSGDLLDPLTGRRVPAGQHLEQLVDRVRPALARHGDLDRVQTALHDLLTHGTGAQRQRAAHARRGLLTDVVDSAVLHEPARA
ncbi:glutamate--cysteine ligase [Kineosporia sp. J2-2]|uniref:Putative glutamate--cysteine ligase 2 n=1 Tax=Kineosporia corallincola TaxID=2835133 RepID=A0ABS5TC41_9ACTN|nr:glutamate--cysteine ligase [Kineosporia corallincola]MBT0768652.1 glutamate--cysteine ligase [Kineosporia corallincola]